MNRRRRSNHQRRNELEVRQQSHVVGQATNLPPPPPTHHHTLPSNYAQHATASQQYYGQPIYHSGHMHPARHVSVPSNAPPYRQPGMIETPLPSPSAFSQLSADGAPSLISDSSSASARSPNNGTSPIELPPLSGSRDERRHSSAAILRLGVPGSFVTDNEAHMPSVHVKQAPHMLQESFLPQHQQSFPQMYHYLPSQPRHPSPAQHVSIHQQHYQMAQAPHLRGNVFTTVPQLPSTPPVQLPSITNLAMSSSEMSAGPSLAIDPALSGVHTPTEGSPKNKMSLSNLTH